MHIFFLHSLSIQLLHLLPNAPPCVRLYLGNAKMDIFLDIFIPIPDIYVTANIWKCFLHHIIEIHFDRVH